MKFDRMNSLAMLAGLCFFAFMMVALVAQFSPDYEKHVLSACSIGLDDIVHPLRFFHRHYYPLWHVLVAASMSAFGLSGQDAAVAVTGFCAVAVVACAWISFFRRHGGAAAATAMCVLLFVAAPMYIPSFNSRLLVGQDSPNVWHNPTHLMVKAVAFPVLVCFCSALDRVWGASAGQVAGKACSSAGRLLFLAVGTLLATLAKPSFIQILFPAFCVVAAYGLLSMRSAAARPLALLSAALAPSLLLLAMQYAMAFVAPGDGGGCALSFLTYWRRTTPNVMVSLLLVSAFPLTMLVLSVATRRFTPGDLLIWLMFAVGVAQKALLIETGPRMWHGNMTWGFSLSVFFIWYFAVDKFALAMKDGDRSPRARASLVFASTVLSAHLVSGMVYVWRLLVLRQWA